MSRLPPLADLVWTEDQRPRSAAFDDIYFSGDGLSETRAVFLEGCGLPEGWQGREHFCIGELGFGSGLNLLALWDLWRSERPGPKARLGVLSFEGCLMRAEDAACVHAAHPELSNLSARLLSQWPVRARGVQRIELGDGVRLTLHIDDIARALPEAEAEIDAWFLDGFAPAKNPDMWSPEAMRHVARLSAPGAKAATYTVASTVRRNLEAAGFEVSKRAGYGRKKERLEARLFTQPNRPPRKTPKRVAVIGAGIAGACAAHAFLSRGCEVDVFEENGVIASGASGNPLALVMPRLDAADGPAARGLIEAYLLARRLYLELGEDAALPIDVRHRPRGETEVRRFEKLLRDPPLDDALLARSEALALELIHRRAVAVQPARALAALMTGATFHGGSAVREIDCSDNAAHITLHTGERRAADLVIVCAGWRANEIAGVTLPDVTPRLGQVEWARSDDRGAIADGGYALETFGKLLFGATFEALTGDKPETSQAARNENLATLARLRPDIDLNSLAELQSRAGVRATTRDRLPYAGAPIDAQTATPKAAPAPQGLIRVIGGLGSRGFLWAPLLAELIASEAFGEPSPVEASVRRALSPNRFAGRALKPD